MATIEISETTFNRFQSVKKSFSTDEVLNQLMDDQEEIEKYIKEYLEGTDECIDETILGRRAIANHNFVKFWSYPKSVCTKCGVVYGRTEASL